MQWITIIAGYFVVWWTVLFAVLPFGTKPAPEADAATGWRGAPIAPRFWRVVFATTLVAAVVWGIAILVITSGWVSFRTGPFALQP